ncbi:MAG TPA: WXG100 family type VII secretion target [Streptosporangiaceae bacterium]|nr:WXG100 family type VII secretion target [Streptosporangiaceae bacterium]
MAASDNQIYVDYGQVSNVHQALQDADRAIQSVLTQLEDVINPLRASWSGASEAEYTAVQARWNNDLNQMNSLLNQYAGTLDDMTVNYGTTDNHLALQWSSIT